MVKMNKRGLKKLEKQSSKAASDAWTRGALKHPDASNKQRARDIAKEMKRAGGQPNERDIRRQLDDLS